MHKYNRGVTIVEILISILIIAIVMVFLYRLFIQVRNEEEGNAIQSQFVIAQSQIEQAVEEDLVDYGVKSIKACNIYNVDIDDNSIYNEPGTNDLDNYKCLEITYNTPSNIVDNTGYIMIYKYYTRYDNKTLQGKDPKWIVRYTKGHFDVDVSGNRTKWNSQTQVTNELPDELDLSEIPYVTYSRTPNTLKMNDTLKIVLPIKDSVGLHYDINLTIDINHDNEFTCTSTENSSNLYYRLKCNCTGDSNLCSSSIDKK